MNKKQLFLIIAVSISSILQGANHDIPYTNNLSLMYAIWKNDIAQAQYVLTKDPQLIHTRTTFCPYGYLHKAQSTEMVLLLLEKGALKSTLKKEELIISAMDYNTHSSVVDFYLRSYTAKPTSVNHYSFTALHELALQSNGYIDSAECLKKAIFLLNDLDDNTIKTLCEKRDLIGDRDVFACIEQSKKSFGRINDFELIHNKACCDQLHDYLKTILRTQE